MKEQEAVLDVMIPDLREKSEGSEGPQFFEHLPHNLNP